MSMKTMRFVTVGVGLPLVLGLFVAWTNGAPQMMNARQVEATIGGDVGNGCPCIGYNYPTCPNFGGHTCTQAVRKCAGADSSTRTCKVAAGPLVCDVYECESRYADICD